MNFKKITFLCLFILLLFPITNIKAYSFSDNIKDGNYLFFLVDMRQNETIELSITHDSSGNFTLFLFNTRPQSSYVTTDRTLDENIFENPAIVAYSLEDNPYINYTALEYKIYYIEIILVSGGPDTFYLTSTITCNNGSTVCNKDLTRYYLPMIPGYQMEVLIVVLISSIGVVVLVYFKKKK